MTASDNILHGPQQSMKLPSSIVSMGVTYFVENEIRNNISRYGDAVWMVCDTFICIPICALHNLFLLIAA